MSFNIQRRRALLGSGALAGASILAACGDGDDEPSLTSQQREQASVVPLIDTHVHIYDTTKFSYPWLANAPPLNKTFDVAAYRAATGPLAVDRYLFQDVAVRDDQSFAEAAWAAELAKGDPRLEGMVAQARFEDGAAVKSALDQLATLGIVRGAWRILNLGFAAAGTSQRAAFVEGVRALAAYKWPFDLACDAAQLTEVTTLVDLCPNVMFVLVHTGFPPIASGSIDAWKSDLASLAQRPNVVCKLSGGITQGAPADYTLDQLRPALEHAIGVFGFDRLIYGGNWPVITLNGGLLKFVAALDAVLASASADARRKLYRGNAIRTYALRPDV